MSHNPADSMMLPLRFYLLLLGLVLLPAGVAARCAVLAFVPSGTPLWLAILTGAAVGALLYVGLAALSGFDFITLIVTSVILSLLLLMITPTFVRAKANAQRLIRHRQFSSLTAPKTSVSSLKRSGKVYRDESSWSSA